MSKIIQIHQKNTAIVLFNTYQSSPGCILISDFLKLCKSKKLIPVIPSQDLITLPDINPILTSYSSHGLDLQEFEAVLTQISNFAFPSLTPTERYSKVLKKLTSKSRTLTEQETSIKSAFRKARKLEISNQSTRSQISLLKKKSSKINSTESVSTLPKQAVPIAENSSRLLKPLEIFKYSRTSSLEIKHLKPKPASKLERAKKMLKDIKKFNFREADLHVKNSVKFVQRQRKKLFSSFFLLKIILNAWSDYAKTKKFKNLN